MDCSRFVMVLRFKYLKRVTDSARIVVKHIYTHCV